MDRNPDPAIARLDARYGNEYGNHLSDRVANLVVHAGDTIKPGWDEHGHLIEYRLYDQAGVHYATFHGHAFPNDALSINAIAYHPSPDERRRLLSLRPQPQPAADPVVVPDANSITVTNPPGTYAGDPPTNPIATTTFGSVPRVTISHEHDHIHTRDDDVLTFAYRHRHHHEHTGPGTYWLADHASEAHDHPHTDHDAPDDPAG